MGDWPVRQIGRGLIRGGVLVAPFVIFASLPPFHTGIWYKSEPVIAALHGVAALTAIGLAMAVAGGDRTATRALWHPFVLLPAALALWGLATAGMAAVPMMSWFGTPEFGQGIAWHLDLAILVAGAMVAVKERRTRQLLAWACGLSTAAVTATMVHTDKDWFLAPFLFYDSLAFYGIFGAAVLLAVIARHRGMPVVAVLGFAVLVIVISGNRTAILLAATAPFLAAACWWLTKYVSRAARPVIALLALIAPVMVTAVIVFSDLAANEASLWSRDLHLTVAREVLIHNPFDLIWGNGWGTYAESQLAYLPVGESDVVGAGGSGPEWDAARGQIHFQSHNFLVEALLSGGLVAMALTWAMVAALPLFCRRRHIVLGGSLAIVAASFLAVWAPDAGAVALIALAFGSLAGPTGRVPGLLSARRWPAVALSLVAVMLAATATATISVGMTMAREARDNRDTTALAKTRPSDCQDMGDDLGRGGVHLATLYRSFAADLFNRRAAGGAITAADAARMADYICAVETQLGDRASLRLANANLLVTAELASVLDDPALSGIRDERLSVWDDRLRWYLERAPSRSDLAAAYLNWAFAEGHEESVAGVAAWLLARNRDSAVGLWFSGAVMMGEATTAREGFNRMRNALEAGIERLMPVDPALADQIRSAPEN